MDNSMEIGKTKKQRTITKAEIILRHIATHPQGLRLGEISKFIYELNYPGESDKRVKTRRWNGDKAVECMEPVYRGYYGTNLCSHSGLLNRYCTKTADRRYVVTEPIVGPFYSAHDTETRRLNTAVRQRQYNLQKAMAPKCPRCNEPNLYDQKNFFSDDGLAHFKRWGRGYKIDCLDRVWYGALDSRGLLTSLRYSTVAILEDGLRNMKIDWDKERSIIERFVLDHVTAEG